MDVHSGTDTEFLEIHDDSQETVAGLTDKDDDSDTEMVGPTNIDDDDGHDDDPSPSREHPIVGVSDIPCDPPMTQEEEIRMEERDLVENINVSLSEGEKKNMGRLRQGIKTKMKPLT